MMIFFFIFTFLVINFIYIKTWNKFSVKVPTGIGVFLTIPCFFFYLEHNLYYLNIVLILIFSFIYYLDDLIEINFFFRILLQIFASIVIYFSFKIEVNFIIILFNLLAFLILVNTLNFQDGEDLNIATFLIIIFCIFYFYSENKFVQNTSVVILFFISSFFLFNMKKKFLYFGDSGCYFVSIIIFLFLYKEINNDTLIKLLIAVIVYPIIDVFYVIIYRIFKKQNLLSRNYLHLYQTIAQKFNSKFYLLPIIFFSAVNIFTSLHFSLGKNFIIFLFITNIVLLSSIRLVIKKLFHINDN
jgi:UDP-N-acetylmuramyl pentapeptide phosphotransferase/UDP-N-acetylglucosamine-1-phosphate transferase